MLSALKELIFGTGSSKKNGAYAGKQNSPKKKRGKRASSKELAKSRLHFVLVQDRTGLTNEEVATFKRELLAVLEKYFVIDKGGFEINYERKGESTTLTISSSVVVKRNLLKKTASKKGSEEKNKDHLREKVNLEVERKGNKLNADSSLESVGKESAGNEGEEESLASPS